MKPKAGESKEEFIKRFMSDEKTVSEYPDEKQRYAVCMKYWDEKEMKSDNIEFIELKQELQPVKKQQKIKVFPRGKFYIEKYKTDIDFNDSFFKQIADSYNAEKLSKPVIDKDHEFKESFGDIEGFEILDDGMYFNIKLNEDGVKLIKDKKYKYISPAFGKAVDNDGKEYENKLKAISLVNFPALEGSLPELQTQLELSVIKPVGGIPTKILKREDTMELIVLANELNLQKDASMDSMLSAIKTLKAEKDNFEKKSIELSNKLTKIENDFISLSKVHQATVEKELKAEATEFIKLSVQQNKVHPSVSEIWIDRYMKNKEATIKELSLIPEKFYDGQKSQSQPNGIELASKEIQDKMLKIGLNPKDAEDVKIFMANYKTGGK